MAANPLKGEVPVPTGSGTYTLVFSIEALIVLEDTFKKPVDQIGELLTDGLSARDLRTLFWAGLQEYHPDLDVKAAGRVISEIGITEAGITIARAFSAAFGTPEPDSGSPQTAPSETAAADGTGAEATVSG